MKKTIMSGVLAVVLIVGGGTAASAQDAETAMQHEGMTMHHEGMTMEQMHEMTGTGHMNFGQMKPFMQKMHPDLNTSQLRELYKEMHGTCGSSHSKNFEEMMGH